ncbi:MAG: leucyl aminopeptidase [Actinomycetota bacterium]|nr:leucyl aminopeptidase [Actinomycetota bacterium]MDP2289074.1 leucyl aminopeptidase [Actinomycetota bacterium]
MTLTLAATAPSSTACDALVIAIVPAKGKAIALAAHGLTAAQANRIMESANAVGASSKSGELTVLPAPSGFAAKKIAVLGLGDFAKTGDLETLRTAVGAAVRSLSGSKKIAIVASPDAEHVLATALAAQLGSYSFTDFKGKAKPRTSASNIVLLVPKEAISEGRAALADAAVLATSVNLSRDLVNTPPNALTPVDLAAAAKNAVAGLPVKVTIWDEKALKRDGCGGILAVGQGSVNPPRLVKMVYAPAGAKASLAIVGKGITFDTGGISIKPAAGMDEMKGDMGGAAAVIGAMQAIAKLGIIINVTGWVPTAENMPGGNAQRPGDVITMFDGTTVEVLNTDAEGRLVLADALGMAVLEKPDLIIDVATLTGAQRIALGSRTAGVMANDDDSRTLVCTAAGEAGEAAWPMPLPEYLRASIDSPTADIANIGDRLGGMLSAGIFLKEFIPAEQLWVHIDIAGPSFNDKGPYGYTPKGGTGSTVRTFVQVAKTLAAG